MVEHRKSGLKMVLGAAVLNWNRSKGELYVAVPGGVSVVYVDGAEDGAPGIQGMELRACWCDEIGLWRSVKKRSGEEVGGLQTWSESIEFAVREEPALILATGTPKGKKGVVKLLAEEPADRVVFTFPSLAANERNLAPAVVEAWHRKWDGTRRGRQELGGEILGDVEGALWGWGVIEANRVGPDAYWLPQQIGRTVVAVDPAITATDTSDETGIVVGQTITEFDDDMRDAWGFAGGVPMPPESPHVVVLGDHSGTYSPTEWARKAIWAYHAYGADRIVAEANQGGDMVKQTIHAIDPNVPVTLVWATKGKKTRAEPVSALYEQGRVHHDKPFPDLEDEQTTWVPGEPSPNHMDALVWLVTELLIAPSSGFVQPAVTEAGESLTADLLTKVM